MPTIRRIQGFRLFFFSNERNEPPHVHVQAGDGYAKLWLGPPVVLAEAQDLTPRQQRLIMQIVKEHREFMEEAWHDHFRT
jgi:hypothetical protein